MMNNENQISKQTQLYGFIGEKAGQSSLCAKTNKLFKQNSQNAMIIPMNIREDDFYFTISNMKKSHVNGAIISDEYTSTVVNIIDKYSEIVEISGMCDFIYRFGEELAGDTVLPIVLIKFLQDKNVKKIAVIGTSRYAKAFIYLLSKEKIGTFSISFYNENLEELMTFCEDMKIQDADINRISNDMDIDFSSYDAVLNFSDFKTFDMVQSFSKINLDMKQKSEFSPLKIKTQELLQEYISSDDLIENLSQEVYKNIVSTTTKLDY